MAKKRVVIVGGGFGGVKAGLVLSKDERFEITLISDQSDLRYYPTLYHAATGGRMANSSIPLSALFYDHAIHLVKGEVVLVDRKAKAIQTADGTSYGYDYVIISLGVVTNYFGIPGLDKYAYGIKSQDEVKHFKKHLHDQLEDQHQPDLNYVIVGGGPTGVELAGALPAYLKQIMKRHGVKDRKIHVDLIEALPKLLPILPVNTSRAVTRRLRRLGVKLYIGKAVEAETADELKVSGKPIRSHTVVWTAGVTNHPFFKQNDFVITKRGKVAVDIYLQAEDSIYVIGDNANTPYSGTAQTALHDGEFVAKNLIRLQNSKQPRGYITRKPVVAVPVGSRWAAVNWGPVKVNGRLGWLLREASYLIGFHDLEPWPKAAKQFITEFDSEDDCPVCAGKHIG